MTEERLSPEDEKLIYLSHIGAVITGWAELELAIDSTIWRAARIEPEIGGCITANLGSIHFKLRSLRALLELNNVSKGVLDDFTTYQGAVSGTAEKRNRVVHHTWGTLDEADGQPMGQFVVKADTKGREFRAVPFPLTDMKNLTVEIERRYEQFCKLRERFEVELPAFDGKQLVLRPA